MRTNGYLLSINNNSTLFNIVGSHAKRVPLLKERNKTHLHQLRYENYSFNDIIFIQMMKRIFDKGYKPKPKMVDKALGE